MRVQNEQITFNVFQSMKFPSDMEECLTISLVSKQFENQLQFALHDNSILDDKNDEEWAWVETKQGVGK